MLDVPGKRRAGQILEAALTEAKFEQAWDPAQHQPGADRIREQMADEGEKGWEGGWRMAPGNLETYA